MLPTAETPAAQPFARLLLIYGILPAPPGQGTADCATTFPALCRYALLILSSDMNLSEFISQNMEQILVEWESFASTFGAVADDMSTRELRDHAKEILQFVCANIQTAETEDQTHQKSQNLDPLAGGGDSASAIHGKLRFESGFSLLQLLAEYRALRASVLKLWQQSCTAPSSEETRDMMRFNEAIDQSLSEAAVAYSAKVNQTRDTFLAILGHDLRGPLAATATAGAYLSRPGAFDDQVKQIGMRVKRSATTMNGMVNDLLELARIQLGTGIPIERRECDLMDMCQWSIEDANAVHPRVRFELHVTGELVGAFDQARLQQLLTNLAINAAQYGAAGKPVIIEVAGESDRVLFHVKNQGPVIAEAALSSLFRQLVQLPESGDSVRHRSSLGLGLFIAKQIALAHGGDIEARSDEVDGTVFMAAIPRA